jgi:ATP/maltotriose-dependent transcriptional regulator MalT
MLLANLASEISRSGDRLVQAVELARVALAGGRLLAELNSAAFAIAIQALVCADELPAALALYDEGLADARARGAISRFMLASAFRAGVAYRLGALDEAEADARAAIDNAEGRHVARFWASAVAVDALLERGAVAEAAVVLEALPISDHPAGAYYMLAPRESRARLRLAQGRAAEAAHELLALGRDLDAVGIVNPAISPWRSMAAIALLRGGSPERALAPAAEEVELARRWGAPRALGIALRAHGLATGDLGALEEAADVLAGSHARLEHARALTDLGAALRRVATMASEGLTNRDIAQSLFVTPKTVEVHLSSADRKLGIGSRTQLAAALR